METLENPLDLVHRAQNFRPDLGIPIRLGVLVITPGGSLVAVHVMAIIISTATLALHEHTEDEILDLDRVAGTLAPLRPAK